jgi:hypothetical protein
MHGAGVNFRYASHIALGRELAARGYPFVTDNNRGHDSGTTLVGHSYGALKAVSYQAEHQDPRIVGSGSRFPARAPAG